MVVRVSWTLQQAHRVIVAVGIHPWTWAHFSSTEKGWSHWRTNLWQNVFLAPTHRNLPFNLKSMTFPLEVGSSQLTRCQFWKEDAPSSNQPPEARESSYLSVPSIFRFVVFRCQNMRTEMSRQRQLQALPWILLGLSKICLPVVKVSGKISHHLIASNQKSCQKNTGTCLSRDFFQYTPYN